MKDLSNQQFGRWIVSSEYEKRGEGRNTRVYWKCNCECGKSKFVLASSLTCGKSTSCGCLQKEIVTEMATGIDPKANRNQPEYKNWICMRQRCNQKDNASYDRYGKIGIEVCSEWNDFQVFLNDMGQKPSPEHTIDRIDASKGYFKENCRWATPKEQVRSRSMTTMLEYNGETKPLAEWSEILGIKYGTLRRRIFIQGMTVQEAFEIPVREWTSQEIAGESAG